MSYASFEYNLRHGGNANPYGSSRPSYVANANEARASHPTMPSYDPTVTDLSQSDLERQNYLSNVEMAHGGNKVADFVINKAPDYEQRIQSAMINGDVSQVENLVSEVSSFVDKHRSDLQPWANLQNNGEHGKRLSSKVVSLLNGDWRRISMFSGPDGQAKGPSINSFLQDDPASNLSRRRGLPKDLARQMTDANSEFHAVFAEDSKMYDDAQKTNPTGIGELNKLNQWSRDKYALVSKYRGNWENQDEAASFFKATETLLPRYMNGGREAVDSMAKAYFEQRANDVAMAPDEFVGLYAGLVRGIRGSAKTVVGDNGRGEKQVYEVPGSTVDESKADGLARAILDVGGELRLSNDYLLRNGELAGAVRAASARMDAIRDEAGFDIYRASRSPSRDIVMTAMSNLGIPGATDMVGFYEDGARHLSSALVTPPTAAVANVPDRSGTPSVVSSTNQPMAPFETTLMKAVSSHLSGVRQGNESFRQTLDRVMGGDGRNALLAKMQQVCQLDGMSPDLAMTVASGYADNLVGGGPRVSKRDILVRELGYGADEDGNLINDRIRGLQAQGMHLGQTVSRDVNGVSTPVKLEASASPSFLSQMAENPSKVMPAVQGDDKSVMDNMSSLARSMINDSGNDGKYQSPPKVSDALRLVESLDRDLRGKAVPAAVVIGSDKPSALSLRSSSPWYRSVNDSLDALKSDNTDSGILLQAAFVKRLSDSMNVGKMISNVSDERSAPLLNIVNRLANNGFNTSDLENFDVSSGIGRMLARNPEIADSPVFNLLFSKTGDGYNVGVYLDQFLASEQRRRLTSLHGSKETRSEETPRQKEARRLLNADGGLDMKNGAANARMWNHANVVEGDPNAALSLYRQQAATYDQIKTRDGAASADAWLEDAMSRRPYYVPRVGPTGARVPNEFDRAETLMTPDEARAWLARRNDSWKASGIPFSMTENEFLESTEIGKRYWDDMYRTGVDIQKRNIISDIEVRTYERKQEIQEASGK